MRIVLTLLALAACAAAYAQRIDGSGGTVRPQQWREREDADERHRTPEPSRPAAKAGKNVDRGKPAPITAVRPVEREPKAPAAKASKPVDALISVRPAPTPPSPAEQMQRRMAEEQRIRRGEQANVSGRYRCNAFPVCDRSTGSYGTCRGVEEMYSATSWREARQQVARDCAAANRPDPCNCAAQCNRVAQCGPI